MSARLRKGLAEIANQARLLAADMRAFNEKYGRVSAEPTPLEASQNGRKPIPNHPKDEIQGNGATQGVGGSQVAG